MNAQSNGCAISVRWPRMDIMMFFEYIFENETQSMRAIDVLNETLPEFHASTWHVFPLSEPNTVSVSVQFIEFPDLLRFFDEIQDKISLKKGYCALTLGHSTHVCGNAKINGTYMRYIRSLHRRIEFQNQTLRFYTGVPCIDLFFMHVINFWKTGCSLTDHNALTKSIDSAIHGIGNQIILDGDKYVNSRMSALLPTYSFDLTYGNMNAMEEVIRHIERADTNTPILITLRLLHASLKNSQRLALPGAHIAPPVYDRIQNTTATELKELLIKENEKAIAHSDTIHALCNTLCGILLGPTLSAMSDWAYYGDWPINLCIMGILFATLNIVIGLLAIKDSQWLDDLILKVHKKCTGRGDKLCGDLRDYNKQLYFESGRSIAEEINKMLPESERIKIQDAEIAFGERLLRTARRRKVKSILSVFTVAFQTASIICLGIAGSVYFFYWKSSH